MAEFSRFDGMRSQFIEVDEVMAMEGYPTTETSEQRIRRMVNEARPTSLGQRVAMENTLRNKEKLSVRLPPHDPDRTVEPGDQIVVLYGEQMGWRGRAVSLSTYSFSVNVRLTRPDGTTTGVIPQRQDAIAVLLPDVPVFEDLQAAEQWMDSQLPLVPSYAAGTEVWFSCPPNLAKRMDASPNQTTWLERHQDCEVLGRVTKFMPTWEANQAGYELLVVVDGEPELIEVAARRIKRLA